jgi:membrane protease YdiL (CAAX protease family)
VLPETSPLDPAIEDVAPPTPHRLARGRALAEVVMCSGYPTQLAIFGALTAVGVTPTIDGELSPRFVFALSGIDTVLMLGLVCLFLKLSKERLRDVFIGNRIVTRELGVGLLLVPALFVLVMVVQAAIRLLAPYLHNVPVNPFETFLESPLLRGGFVTLVVIAGGVREELQRAFLLHRFEQRLGGGLVGVLVTSAAFGLGHTLQGWDAAIVTGLLGAWWGMIYLARRSIIANVTSHATFNVVQVLAGFSSVARPG